jgi:hypothetical protein
MPWITGTEDDSVTAFRKFPKLYELVAKDYTFETKIEHFFLYHRKSDISSHSR